VNEDKARKHSYKHYLQGKDVGRASGKTNLLPVPDQHLLSVELPIIGPRDKWVWIFSFFAFLSMGPLRYERIVPKGCGVLYRRESPGHKIIKYIAVESEERGKARLSS
jgi:hypothetical protein